MSFKWHSNAKESFDRVINSLPQFHRSIAQRLVKERAQALARQRGAPEVEVKDLVRAFFAEVPPAFEEMMKRLLSQMDIDYTFYLDDQAN